MTTETQPEVGVAHGRAMEDFLRGKFKVGPDGCWLWTGSIRPDGYPSGKPYRRVEELARGPIEPGLHVDHTCHVAGECTLGIHCLHRRCVNPDHLERVTRRENWLRSNSALVKPKGTCRRGHDKEPGKHCVTCKREQYRARQDAWRAATGRPPKDWT